MNIRPELFKQNKVIFENHLGNIELYGFQWSLLSSIVEIYPRKCYQNIQLRIDWRHSSWCGVYTYRVMY